MNPLEVSSVVTAKPKKPRREESYKFTCTQCDKKFKRQFQFDIHLKAHQGVKPLQCPQCDKSFSRPCQLTNHQKQHTRPDRFHCELCPRSYKNKKSLNIHTRKGCQRKTSSKKAANTNDSPREKKLACSICDKRFSKKSHLVQHMLTHSDVRRFKCSLCDLEFKTQAVLTTHMCSHSLFKSVKCPKCPRLFKFRSSMTSHVKHHHEKIRVHECKLCPNKKFATRDALKRHRLSKGHWEREYAAYPGTEVPYYVCPICNRNFVKPIQLLNHKNIVHSNCQKTFMCEICSKQFRQLSHLNTHLKVHQTERPYGCQKCEKTYKRSDHLNNHMKRVHNKAPRDRVELPKIDFIVHAPNHLLLIPHDAIVLT